MSELLEAKHPMSHQLIARHSLRGKSKTIAWKCENPTCDSSGSVTAVPSSAADGLFAIAEAVHWQFARQLAEAALTTGGER